MNGVQTIGLTEPVQFASCNYDGYVNQKASDLKMAVQPLLDGHFELAHFAIEVAIDLLLVDN